MFLTTDDATAQVKLLLGSDRCLRLEPQGEDAAIEMDDYDAAFARLRRLSVEDFVQHREMIGHFFETTLPRASVTTAAVRHDRRSPGGVGVAW